MLHTNTTSITAALNYQQFIAASGACNASQVHYVVPFSISTFATSKFTTCPNLNPSVVSVLAPRKIPQPFQPFNSGADFKRMTDKNDSTQKETDS